MGEVGAAAGKADPDRRARPREYFVFLVELEQLAAEDVDQPAFGIEDRDDMDTLIEQFQDLLAGPAGRRPDEITVNAGRDLFADGAAVEQLSADIAVGDRSDHAPAGILGKQDAEHVDVEPPKCFLDRFGLSNGKERAIQQFSGPKGSVRPRLRGK